MAADAMFEPDFDDGSTWVFRKRRSRAAAIKAASAASAVKARVPGTRSYFQELGAEQVLVNDVAFCEEQAVTGCISPGGDPNI